MFLEPSVDFNHLLRETLMNVFKTTKWLSCIITILVFTSQSFASTLADENGTLKVLSNIPLNTVSVSTGVSSFTAEFTSPNGIMNQNVCVITLALPYRETRRLVVLSKSHRVQISESFLGPDTKPTHKLIKVQIENSEVELKCIFSDLKADIDDVNSVLYGSAQVTRY